MHRDNAPATRHQQDPHSLYEALAYGIAAAHKRPVDAEEVKNVVVDGFDAARSGGVWRAVCVGFGVQIRVYEKDFSPAAWRRMKTVVGGGKRCGVYALRAQHGYVSCHDSDKHVFRKEVGLFGAHPIHSWFLEESYQRRGVLISSSTGKIHQSRSCSNEFGMRMSTSWGLENRTSSGAGPTQSLSFIRTTQQILGAADFLGGGPAGGSPAPPRICCVVQRRQTRIVHPLDHC